ncbi:MAG: GntR family transcriptional regulator [Victivallales bacterium]|nr:GntR family transcriptional regulator [Victivallales bacterium]
MNMDIKQRPLVKDQVIAKVLSMISALKLQPGDRLASEKTLAVKFHVNHLTLRAAYAELAERGLLERRRGSGTFIKRLPGNENDVNALRLSSTRTVVVAMRDDPHFFSGLRNDIINEAQNRGFLPIVLGSGNNITQSDVEKLKAYQEMGAGNLIIDQAEAVGHSHNLAYLSGAGCKYKNIVRVLGNLSDDERLPGCMISGDYAGAYMKAVAHLKENGHNNIAFFCGTTTKDNNAWRANKKFISLYTQAMIENDLSEYINVITASYENVCMDDAIKTMLNSADRPTAVFCDIDYRAVKVIDVAKSMKLEIPEDLSVIGFFDTPWSQHYGISTFKFRNKDIAKLVVDALENNHDMPKLNLFPIDLIERDSVSVAKEQATLSI